MGGRLVAIGWIAALASVLAGPAAGQSVPGSRTASTLGISMQTWGVPGGDAFPLLALHAGAVAERGFRPDITLATWVPGLLGGGLFLKSDVSLGYGFTQGDAVLIARTGASLFVCEFGLLPGVHAGLTMMTSGRVGIRFDVTGHAYTWGDRGPVLGLEVVPALTIGVGITRVRWRAE